jgi:hypothetical protein
LGRLPWPPEVGTPSCAHGSALCAARPLGPARYLEEFSEKLLGDQKTAGAISVHINSNENTDSQRAQNWIDFDAGWTDDAWHHVAVTWDWEDGTTKAYVDGVQKTAFWKSK